MTWQKQLDDGRVAKLLREMTEDIPGDIDLQTRVRQRLALVRQGSSSQARRSTHARMSMQRRLVPRWGYLMGSAIVLVGLLFSAFAFARPLIFSWLGDNGLRGISLQNATLVDRAVTVQGITIRVEQAYADAARTALTMRIQVPQGHQMVTPRIDTAYLLDEHGHRYAVLTGTQVDGESLFEFIPLPISVLSSEQRLTLLVQTVLPTVGSIPISGPWQVSFQVYPQAGRSITLAVPPVSQGKVTMRPERLDLTAAGVRLVLRINGLARDTSLLDVTHFAHHGSDTIVGCPPNSHTCVTSSSTSGGALLQLEGADGQIIEPSWILAIDPTAPDVGVIPNASQVVGASGTALIEILFATPLHVAHGTAHLTIDELHLQSSQVDIGGKEQMASGPWRFALTLP